MGKNKSENTCDRAGCTNPIVPGFEQCMPHVIEDYPDPQEFMSALADGISEDLRAQGIPVIKMSELLDQTRDHHERVHAPAEMLAVINNGMPRPRTLNNDAEDAEHERMNVLSALLDRRGETYTDAEFVRIVAIELLWLAVEVGYAQCLHSDQNPGPWRLLEIAERVDRLDLGVPEHTAPEPTYGEEE